MEVLMKTVSKFVWLVFLLVLTSCESGKTPVVTLQEATGDILFYSERAQDGNLGQLYLISLPTGTLEILAETDDVISTSMSWAPNGERLAFVAILTEKGCAGSGQDAIFILDSQGNRELFGPCRVAPAWSPDGNFIAFHDICKPLTTHLKIATVDGEQERTVVPDLLEMSPTDRFSTVEGNRIPSRDINLSWSADMNYLVYDKPISMDQQEIWIVDLEQENALYLVGDGGDPEWSPIANEIAFTREGDIWLYDLESQTSDRLMEVPGNAHRLTWSPDGQMLAFTSTAGADIYLVNRDGTGLKNITNSPEAEFPPVWRP